MALEEEISAAPEGLSSLEQDSGSIPFSIFISRNDDGAHVVLLGELDTASAPLLRERLSQLIAEGPDSVVLDLASLDFIDSSGLAVIVAAHKACEVQQSTLIVRSPTLSAHRIFEITGLTKVLRIESAP
jgi:anti-sigma B factor antagonist